MLVFAIVRVLAGETADGIECDGSADRITMGAVCVCCAIATAHALLLLLRAKVRLHHARTAVHDPAS